jgi:hypothetical protein
VQIDECETKGVEGNNILACPLEETKKNTNKATMDMFEENKNQMC